ncbi:MAG: glycosyltransferase [bacterium]|nr:glycosyltransferase [bacterium]
MIEAAIAAFTAAYVAGLLWFLLGATRRSPSIDATVPSPSVAVVIAARDEATRIEPCLRALAEQTYPRDLYQVILVDDGSTDGTQERARALAASLSAEGHRMSVLDGPAAYGRGGSKKAALSLGISHCNDAAIVLTTDADCDVPPGWIRAMVDGFSTRTGAVIGFSQIGTPATLNSTLARWEGLDFLLLMTAAAGSCAFGHPMAASGQSLGFRRRAFDEVGGYTSVQHRVSGDDVLLLQLIRGTRCWRLGFCGEASARVVHPPSPSLRSFLSRRARWASNAPLQLRLDPLFFLYMSATFGAAVGLLTSLGMWAAGLTSLAFVAAVWGVRATAEGALAIVGARRFGRLDLLRVFPLWVLLQPLYTVMVGLAGPLGFFRWKGRRVALGRRAKA